jgi:hypothetical protein
VQFGGSGRCHRAGGVARQAEERVRKQGHAAWLEPGASARDSGWCSRHESMQKQRTRLARAHKAMVVHRPVRWTVDQRRGVAHWCFAVQPKTRQDKKHFRCATFQAISRE